MKNDTEASSKYYHEVIKTHIFASNVASSCLRHNFDPLPSQNIHHTNYLKIKLLLVMLTQELTSM